MAAKKTKYIFISGGVLSSLGKGIASASLGLLLKQRGLSVTIMKFDPYINVDPGTMNPQQHGEVYVTDDGAECDLDLGHYERFLDVDGTRANSVSSGQVYFEVIQRERQGQYLGKTVQVIPHITDEIKRRMTIYDKMFDIVIIEIGGTVGDIESLPFMESVRQLCMEKGPKSTLNIHLTYVPYIKSAGELKTKPTQHSVKMLMEMGIRPDILLCRTEQAINKELKSKIALFCNVEEDSVIEVLDAETIYEVPMSLAKRNLDQIVLRKFSVTPGKIDLDTWTKFVNRIKQPKHTVNIALVGKYNQVKDSYKSILEAFVHAGAINNAKVDITWIDSESITRSNVASVLKGMQGILVAPGFGSRGIEGKIEVIKHAREQKIPFFGICLGMQCAVIEFARNVAGLKDAHSAEFKKGKDLVIHLMSAQKQVTDKGGTMRLGSYPCTIRKGTIAHAAYGSDTISERHRHRYEFNNAYRKTLEDHGMKLSGVSPDTTLVEIIELKSHPWFVGVQFHPEYKSRAVKGHPLFISFVKAALQKK
ncbi:MAG: CTP synthase [Ignavibacteria bacterium]|jgi:CTP synthase|nr:CTP synthase [Chlorobiota bacterium]